jgi:hypothetical protein
MIFQDLNLPPPRLKSRYGGLFERFFRESLFVIKKAAVSSGLSKVINKYFILTMQ